MDLMKVEGLSDLINAETEAQRAQSLNHYLGSASEVLEGWRKTLIQCLAHAEAYIDFEEHEVSIVLQFLLKKNRKMLVQMYMIK